MILVSDGMGGHAGGAEASDVAQKAASEALRVALLAGQELKVALRSAVQAANRAVHSLRNEQRFSNEEHKPGATISLALRAGDRTHIAWVGDSPIYRYRPSAQQGKRVEKLTIPDNMAFLGARLADDPARAMAHLTIAADSNVLFRALGSNPDLDSASIHVESVDFRPGDMLIAGSDGLEQMRRTREVPSAGEIEGFLDQHAGEHLAQARFNAAKSGSVHPDAPVMLATALAKEARKRGRFGKEKHESDDVAVSILHFPSGPVDITDRVYAASNQGRAVLGKASALFDGFIQYQDGHPIDLTFGNTPMLIARIADLPRKHQRDLLDEPNVSARDLVLCPPDYSSFNVLQPGRPVGLGRAHNQMFANDPDISRNHVRIEVTDQGEILFSDQGSTNGTYVGAAQTVGQR